ncbi:CPBP family intramembrane metalloprotease [Pseudomonas laurylsulfativorans]|uniref:CPBP family intramembrane metalloprotease n=1 Tax=Pseudomonas laurylsulfativorans TaxID=1943631 RepID=A0A2S3VHB1_9PSED|nr:type II CAAX endopeptidase family protein [Pseudomonas laurylsulfativorans]POF39345.1 CPBP family intramembrane metalloprotease [Pseudomonas laurylsulfativorans]
MDNCKQPTDNDESGADERFHCLEYLDDDFPYYNGKPVGLSGKQWLLLMLGVLAGFLVLIAPLPLFAGNIGQFIPATLFFAIPLATLACITPQHWTALLRRVTGRDIKWMILFALLNIVVTMVIGLVVMKTLGTHSNPVFAGMATQTPVEHLLFFLKTLPQLLGEEVLTILPFLALMTFLNTRLHWSRKGTIVGAWLLSALLFGAAHLPTYDWNMVQAFVVIGSARLVLLLPYIMTKNIWVSTGAHILNDWTLFIIALLGAIPPGH